MAEPSSPNSAMLWSRGLALLSVSPISVPRPSRRSGCTSFVTARRSAKPSSPAASTSPRERSPSSSIPTTCECRHCGSTSKRLAPAWSSSPCSTTRTAACRSTSAATTRPDPPLSAACQHDSHPPAQTSLVTPLGSCPVQQAYNTTSTNAHNPKVAGSNPAPATNVMSRDIEDRPNPHLGSVLSVLRGPLGPPGGRPVPW